MKRDPLSLRMALSMAALMVFVTRPRVRRGDIRSGHGRQPRQRGGGVMMRIRTSTHGRHRLRLLLALAMMSALQSNIASAAGRDQINTINGPVCDPSIQVPSEVATIQEAIDDVCDGGEVVVEPGTYTETINFNGKAITLRSASGNPADTIIDGGASGSVVTCESGEGSGTVLDGFTITGGTGDTSFGVPVGGGMLNNDSSSPTVTNCILWGNVDDADGSIGRPFMDESAQIHTASGTPVVNYNIVQGWTGVADTNINADPLFVDDDMDTDEDTSLDLDEGNRFLDDPSIVDSGAGTPPIVDMGAFEFSLPVFVDAVAGGLADGTSWIDAYTTLQDALADARITGGEANRIWVASGTYYPDEGGSAVNDDRTETFQLLNGVSILGGFAGGETAAIQRDPAVNETILSGDLQNNDTDVVCVNNSPNCEAYGGLCGSDGFCIIRDNNAENSFHVITGSGTDTTAVLDGFTVTAGNANGSFPDDAGGGMLINAGNPTVTNCTFSGNTADTVAGGMFNNSSSSPTVTDCTFSGNTVKDYSGGGMFNNSSSSPTITNCTFSGNTANFHGGGMYNYGNSSPTVTACVFSGNHAAAGAGMFNTGSSDPTVTNCTFSGNMADSGGGMFNITDSDPTVTNCTFSGNMAGTHGGGMYNYFDSDPTVTNCILWGNVDDADGNSGGPFMDESAQIHTDSGIPAVNYSIVQGGWSGAGGVGIVDADPLFANADGLDGTPGTDDDDLHLLPGSPCIDAADFGAFDSAGGGVVDLDGNPRLVDDLNTGDSGIGDPTYLDMGAYEFLAGDCNRNGEVTLDDFADLAACLQGPGVAVEQGCLCFDADVTGTVDLRDVAEFQLNLGQ